MNGPNVGEGKVNVNVGNSVLLPRVTLRIVLAVSPTRQRGRALALAGASG
jgi:hypothetical protein